MLLQCGPDSWASPGTLLAMHILRFHPRPDEPEPWEWAQGSVFNMLSRGLWREICCLRGFWAKLTSLLQRATDVRRKGDGHTKLRGRRRQREGENGEDCWGQERGGELSSWRAGVSNSCPWLCPWWLGPWPQQDGTGKASHSRDTSAASSCTRTTGVSTGTRWGWRPQGLFNDSLGGKGGSWVWVTVNAKSGQGCPGENHTHLEKTRGWSSSIS